MTEDGGMMLAVHLLKRGALYSKVNARRTPVLRPIKNDFLVFIEDNRLNVPDPEALWDKMCYDQWHYWHPKKEKWIGIKDWRAWLRRRFPSRLFPPRA